MSNSRYYLIIINVLWLTSLSYSQEDLLEELEAENKTEIFNYPAFKTLKIGNLQSTKIASKGEWYMFISHRFGTLKDGASTFFGLDNANTKLQMLYGLFEGVQVGLSRESVRKTFAGSVKMDLLKQSKDVLLNMVIYSTINLNTILKDDQYAKMEYADRLSYATQLLISRRINNKLSVEIAPSFIRQNLVYRLGQDHNQVAMGLGGRYKLSKRLSINMDYVFNFNRASDSNFNDPLTIGIDIETGGHVFQLLFSNAQSANEPGFISNAEGEWSEGNIFFGFNIVRVF